jgi:transport and Golgi organization protein 2
MCSVSIVPLARGFRVACNRDERRSRPPAEPPSWHVAGRLTAVWPVDPVGGGTWIGTNDAGLAAVLLNRTPPECAAIPGSSISRGTIIPRLMPADTIAAALTRVPSDLTAFQPFTLVLIQGGALATVAWDGRARLRRCRLVRPRLFTSSSSEARVAASRRHALFSQLVLRGAAPLGGQTSFHNHRWPDRPGISVVMSRRDAATVSRTVLVVAAGAIRMRYEPINQQQSVS